MIFVRRAEEISMRSIIRRVAHHVVELRKEVDRILRHLDVDRRRELRAHTAHALPGRAFALMRFAFNHKHIGATRVREVIIDTRADNAATDDDYVCGFSHSEKVSRKGAKIAKKKGEQSRSPFPGRLLSPPACAPVTPALACHR